ncbi:MAG: hypothetical protein Q7S35_11170 [Candidatus Limnocylindrales bacterium]|nr:hypothetical protein [Candidatus Limnocylindrales bacterium]
MSRSPAQLVKRAGDLRSDLVEFFKREVQILLRFTPSSLRVYWKESAGLLAEPERLDELQAR